MTTETTRGAALLEIFRSSFAALLEIFRSSFAALPELEKVSPRDVDLIVAAIVAHVRAFRPEAVTPLGVLPAPTDVIRDPRGDR